MYAAWDGEEEGLLGSTEWAETHADELRAKGVVYINSDSNGARLPRRRRLAHAGAARHAGGARRARSGAQRLRAGAHARARDRSRRTNAEERKEARERQLIRLDALGSGSDYTPFLQHLGIASLNIGYGGEGGGGSYHSIYDSFDHYTRFGDPNFDYGIAQAKTTGRLVLRLANADVLPFEFDYLRRHAVDATSTS